VIRVEGVTKYYFGQPVLDDVWLEVPTGINLGLIGPGGSGKSLLTKIIVGLVPPDAGKVFVDDEEVTALNEIDLARVRLKFGMLFQNYALFDFMDVGGNVAFPLRQEGRLGEDEIRTRVSDLLTQVDLPGIEHLKINELSGGMKKRVSFARAVVREPPFLIYDDPTAGLDPVTSSKIFIMLKRIKDQHGTTSITISHDLYGMREVCDHWAMLRDGALAFSGTQEEMAACQDPFVREFWEGGMNIP
jgi:phospholipid/cholesterol/gamma-HCH transport system ATP-binding protein